MSSTFVEYPIPDLPGITVARIGRDGVYNYYFGGAYTGDLFELPPGFVFADATTFPEFKKYRGDPVQMVGARITVRGHDIEHMVFEIDQNGFRASLLWGGYIVMRRGDAIAGTQLLVLID